MHLLSPFLNVFTAPDWKTLSCNSEAAPFLNLVYKSISWKGHKMAGNLKVQWVSCVSIRLVTLVKDRKLKYVGTYIYLYLQEIHFL